MPCIPRYPIFQKLKLNHKSGIEKITHKFFPYSDYNFTSLWTYNTDESLEISLLNNNLVVKFVDYLTNKPFYSFIGNNQIIRTANILINLAIKKNFPPLLKLIGEQVIKSEKKINNFFLIKEDSDNHDYIVSAKDIAILDHLKFKRKRYLVDRFKNKYPGYTVKRIDLRNPIYQKMFLDFFLVWEKSMNKKKSETHNEIEAIKRLLKNIDILKEEALGIFLNNKLIAINAFEICHKSYGVSSFQKADKQYTGVYAMISHETAKHLHSKGIKFINYEQDLGIEGLRLSKSLWKPIHFLKKYIIAPKT